MVSSAIWKKHARVRFSKTIEIALVLRNCTSPKDECMQFEVFEKLTSVYMFFQIARETILLLVNSIHEKI